MRVKNGEGHQARFHEGVLLTDAPEGRITLTPTLAHALGRALLVYANRNGVGRETLDEAPPRVSVGDPLGAEYRRAVRDLIVGDGRPYPCSTCGTQLGEDGRCARCANEAAEAYRQRESEMMGGPKR